MSYTAPTTIPNPDSRVFKLFLRAEFQKLAKKDTVASGQLLDLQPLHSEPAKPRKGYVVYADGTDWNPGSGEGVYRHDGTAWNFLG